jgi:hypothetical protein
LCNGIEIAERLLEIVGHGGIAVKHLGSSIVGVDLGCEGFEIVGDDPDILVGAIECFQHLICNEGIAGTDKVVIMNRASIALASDDIDKFIAHKTIGHNGCDGIGEYKDALGCLYVHIYLYQRIVDELNGPDNTNLDAIVTHIAAGLEAGGIVEPGRYGEGFVEHFALGANEKYASDKERCPYQHENT